MQIKIPNQAIAILLIEIFIICLYLNSLTGSFHLDDHYLLDRLTQTSFSQFLSSFSLSKLRFLTDLSFFINYLLHQNHVFGYHLINLTIHLSNSFLLWLLVSTGLSQKFFRLKLSPRERLILPLMSMIWFGVHPIGTTATTYITQRYTLMATFFYLLVIICFQKATYVSNKTKKRIYFFLSLLCLIAGVYSKEIIFSLPLVLLLFQTFNVKKIILLFIGVSILLIPWIIHNRFFAFSTKDTPSGELVNSNSYLLTQTTVIPRYLYLSVLPLHQQVEYDQTVKKNIDFEVVRGSIIILCTLFIAIVIRKKFQIISIGIFWFFFTLIIESSIIPIKDIIFEHRVYLPLVGFSLFIPVIFQKILPFSPKINMSLFITYCLILSLLTINRNRIWSNEWNFWQQAVLDAPNNPRTHLNYGVQLQLKGNLQEAYSQYQSALKINPRYLGVWDNIGSIFVKQGKYDQAEKAYRKEILQNPLGTSAPNNLASLLIEIGKYDEAQQILSQLIIQRPHFPEAYNNLGHLAFKTGNYSQAITYFSTALTQNPNFTIAKNNLIKAKYRLIEKGLKN